MTLEEKKQNIREKRSNALNSRMSLLQSKQNAQELDDFNNTYLWGDGSNYGVMDFIHDYYSELNYEYGRTYSDPSLSNFTESWWESALESAISNSGDGSDGIYPGGSTDQDINTSSPLLNNNGDNGETTLGLIGDGNSVLSVIGESATVTGPHTSDQTFADSSTAQSAAINFLYNGNLSGYSVDTGASPSDIAGSGIRGRRTRDVEITTTDEGGVWSFTIGDGTIDSSDFFSDSTDINGQDGNLKTDLLNALSSIISSIESGSSYYTLLEGIRDELDKIFDSQTNTLFIDSEMDADITDDSVNIETHLSQLDTWVGSGSDAKSDNTFNGYYNFFSGASGTESDFDTQLDNAETLTNDFKSNIGRETDIDTVLGEGPNGSNSGLKKWRFFWLKQRIEKPDASLITVSSIDTAINGAESRIQSANATLTELFGNAQSEREQWMPRPDMFSAFFEPLRNEETGEVIERRNGIVFGGQPHTSEYRIYKREVLQSLPIDNSDWSDDYLIATQTELSPDTGFVKLTYKDDVNLEFGKSYLYRVSTYDDQNQFTYESSSLQSKIFDDTTSFDYEVPSNESITVAGMQINTTKLVLQAEEIPFSAGVFIVIKDDTNPQNNGFYQIMRVQDTNVWVNPTLFSNTNTGTVHPTSAVAVVSE